MSENLEDLDLQTLVEMAETKFGRPITSPEDLEAMKRERDLTARIEVLEQKVKRQQASLLQLHEVVSKLTERRHAR